MMTFDHPRVRNSDPMTSWMAAGSAKDLAKAHATKIIQCLKDHGSLGKDGIAEGFVEVFIKLLCILKSNKFIVFGNIGTKVIILSFK